MPKVVEAEVLDPDSWQTRDLAAKDPGLDHYPHALLDLVERGYPIVAESADLKHAFGLDRFAAKHPERFIAFGIAEQNMVSVAAGLATAGQIPFVSTFASFLGLLCCEQIRMDIAYCALPVRLVGHHTGISMGFYGTSHHATEDIGTTRSIADLTIISPADGPQLAAAVRASADWPQPIYFRVGRGREPDIYDQDTPFIIGKAIEHSIGHELTLIASGMPVHSCLEAAARLQAEGRSIGVINMPTIKPLDHNAIFRAASRSKALMTVEEHNVLGGLGAAVAEVLSDEGAGVRLMRHGIRDEFALIAPPTHLYQHYQLDATGVEKVARSLLKA